MPHPLQSIPAAFGSGQRVGITSICSAHPFVIEAALDFARECDREVLIEATCNQVNQDGGYTGMTPQAFRKFVEDVAQSVGLPTGRIILGGDHLGPNPWRSLPPEAAMAKAEDMISAYAAAGFTKLHLDCSMGCAGEPAALDDAVTAVRAARLAARAEAASAGSKPVYVIGTEVPVPGGATEELADIHVTPPEAAERTVAAHQEAFSAAGLDDAFDRVVALVVQPGVEFGHSDVVPFRPERASNLSRALKRLPGMVFEAHSTDYQSGEALAALVEHGFAILKVGPWLTFALREAFYSLDAMADVLEGSIPKFRLMAQMERLMQSRPTDWERYYGEDDERAFLRRHFSYSDRIRYYWPEPPAMEAVASLMARIEGKMLPRPLLSQFAPALLAALPPGRTAISGKEFVMARLRPILQLYQTACGLQQRNRIEAREHD